MSGNLDLLVIVGQLERGGTEAHLLNVLPLLQGEAFRVSVYALRGGGALEPAMVEAGVPVMSPPHHSRGVLGLMRTARHLLATLRHRKPRIVHYFLPEAYLLGASCASFAPPCIELMSRRSLNHYQRKRPLAALVECGFHRRMNLVLGNSRAVCRELAGEGVPRARLGLIYNGVAAAPPVTAEQRRAARGVLGIPDDAFVLLLVANIIPYKGHADLITAVALARRRLSADWCLLLVGEDRGQQAEFEERARAGGVAKHIRWIGAAGDTRSHLAASDVALNVSHEEGFSNAVLEAMAAGLPVIVTDVGGNAEAVVHGENGLVVRTRAPSDLAEAITKLDASAALRQRMGQAALERIRTRFGIGQCVEAYRDTYAALTTGAPRQAIARASGAFEASPRVLFVVTEDWYFVSHRLALARHLQARGYEIHLATRVGRHRAVIEAAGVRIHDLPFERSLRHPFTDLRATYLLAGVVRRQTPDIVHLVSLKPILVGALVSALARGNLRAVWAFTGMGFIFTSTSRTARLLRPLIVRALRALNRRDATTMVVQNNDDAAMLTRSGIAATTQVVVVPGAGVDDARFQSCPSPPEHLAPIVLLPARLLRDKGIYEFVAAARLLRARGSSARFVLVGRLDRDNHAAVSSADLEAWQHAGVVEWWGHRDDMPAVYAQASIVCLPSYREGLPMALLEAAASARPLVACDVPGSREICVNGETGLLVSPRDADGLADAISALLDDPAHARGLGCAAAAHAAGFRAEAVAVQTDAVYRNLVAQEETVA